MIDTDKYEGHTEAPWKYNDKWGLIKYGQIEIAALHSGNSANAQLIADAPLLLAEVKRLREENNRYLDFILWLGIEHEGKKLAWEYGDEELAEMIE